MLIYRHKKRLEAEANEQKRQSQARRKERHAAETEQEAQRNEETLTGKKVPELKNIAKEQGIEGFSNMKKDELIQAIEGD